MGFRSFELGLFLVAIATFCGVIGAVNGTGIGTETEALEKKKQREFDYFALALQWAPTYCRRTTHCCSNNACCRGENSPTEFTIHGLWPDYNDGTWPACCTQKRFNEKEVSSLLDALKKYWPSLSCGLSKTCHGTKGPFWAHEWEKHGTCSSPVVLDEYNYFLTTLNVYFKYNVTKVLNEAGYVPSNSEKYPLGGIVTAIQNAFHTTPQLICKKGAIEELRLCFYKDFKPRDCVSESISKNNVSSSNSCPKYISIPQYMPSRVGDAEAKIPWILDEEEETEEHSSS